MKKPDSGRVSLPLLLTIAGVFLVPLLLVADSSNWPAWWTQRGVLTPNTAPDHGAVLNTGQLKNLAAKGLLELRATTPASVQQTQPFQALETYVATLVPNPASDDYAVNQGQLKNVAKYFYDVLIETGYSTGYPWVVSPAGAPDHHALANQGQAKFLFSFDVLKSTADGDSIPDWWELKHGFPPETDHTGIDSDTDGADNLAEYWANTDPTDYYNGVAPTLTVLSGNNQTGAPGSFTVLPLVVKVTDSSGTPKVNSPVSFTVQGGFAGLAFSKTGSPQRYASITLRTDSSGIASIDSTAVARSLFLEFPSTVGTPVSVEAQAGLASAAFVATPVALSETGLVAHWKLNEENGLIANDSTNDHLDGEVKNSPARTGGFNTEGGIQFNGTNQFIDIGNPAGRLVDFGGDSFSIALWVKYTNTSIAPGHFGRRIVSKGHHGWNAGYFIGLHSSGRIDTGIGASSGGKAQSLLFGATTPYNDGQWHHVAVVFDRENSKAKIYVDGIAQPLTQESGTFGTVIGSNELDFAGAQNLSATRLDMPLTLSSHAGAYDFFDGSMDDVRIYRKALTASEVTAIYNLSEDTNQIADHWEMEHFGQIGINPLADPDGDSATNLQEAQANTNPTDYYSRPSGLSNLQLVKISGDQQSSAENSYLAAPLVLEVRDGTTPLVNAPVTFTLVGTNGGLSGSPSETNPSPTFATTTDATGQAKVYYRQGVGVTTETPITATAGPANPIEFSILPPTPIPASIEIVSGNKQGVLIDQWATHPIRFLVKDSEGNPLSAPMQVDVAQLGLAAVALSTTETPAPSLSITTDANGYAEFYIHAGPQPTAPARIRIRSPFNIQGRIFAELAIRSAATSPTVTAGLLAWYAGEGNAQDSWGLHHGSSSGVTYVPALRGNGFDFNSLTDLVSTAVTNGENRSLTAWIKPRAASGTDPATILSSSTSEITATGLLMSGTEFLVHLDDTTWQTGQTATTNSWQQVTLTVSPTEAKLFKNGSQVAVQTYPQGEVDQLLFKVGSLFDGLIDEVGIYERALTATEVAELFNTSVDTDGDGLSNVWEIANGFDPNNPHTNDPNVLDGALDSDGDGRSNLQELLAGTNPNDFYDGVAPFLTIVSGNNQGDFPEQPLAYPLRLRVTRPSGSPMVSAQVTFSIESGGGQLTVANNGQTDSNGIAEASLVLPATVGEVIRVRATAGNSPLTAFVEFTASVGDAGLAPAAPGKPSITLSEDETTAVVTWVDNSNNETSFYVDRSDNGSTWERRTTLDANTTTYTDTGLVAGTAYFYKIIAKN